MEVIIVLGIILVIAIFVTFKITKAQKEADEIELSSDISEMTHPSPPETKEEPIIEKVKIIPIPIKEEKPIVKSKLDYSFLMGISPNYTCLGENYIPMLDLVAKYNGNMLRVFGYNGWRDNALYFPWNGSDYTNLNQSYFDNVRNFVKEANDRGIIVIFSLFQNNSGGGAENITRIDGSLLRPYMYKLIDMTKDLDIIYESINEDSNANFNNFVKNEIKDYYPEAKCCMYKNWGADYKIIHTAGKSFVGGKNLIQSNDKGGYTRYLNAGDYYNIAKEAKRQGGHVEFLIAWGTNPEGFIGNNPVEMERQSQEMLNLLKTLRG